MNSRTEQAWPDQSTPYQVATFEKSNEHDPVAEGAKRNNFIFLESLLVAQVKKKMLADPKWSGNEALIESLAPQTARDLITKWNDPAPHWKPFAEEIELVCQAMAMRNGEGKTDDEIIKILQAKLKGK